MVGFADFLTTSDKAAMKSAAGIATPKPVKAEIKIESVFNPDGTYTGRTRMILIGDAPKARS